MSTKYRLRVRSTTTPKFNVEMRLDCWDDDLDQEHQRMAEAVIDGLSRAGYAVEATRETTTTEPM